MQDNYVVFDASNGFPLGAFDADSPGDATRQYVAGIERMRHTTLQVEDLPNGQKRLSAPDAPGPVVIDVQNAANWLKRVADLNPGALRAQYTEDGHIGIAVDPSAVTHGRTVH